MADSTEPKKETVRITVSPQSGSPSSSPTEGSDTVRIHLPTRPPANPPVASTEPSSPARAATAAMPAPLPTPASPRKETARITALPDPPAKPVVQTKKTQLLIDLPAMEKPVAPLTVAPESQPASRSRVDQIPMPLCWALFGASVAILILQIWNYLS
jgi:hypothetical protein